MKNKNLIVAALAVLMVCTAIVFVLDGDKGDVSDVNRVVGYSELYDDVSINKACDIVERKFAEEFEGCTLTELRYDVDVENKFASEIERYAQENNQDLIVLLSTFDTDPKGGDGSFNPNDTYTNWQWHLVRTADKKSWEIITWGY